MELLLRAALLRTPHCPRKLPFYTAHQIPRTRKLVKGPQCLHKVRLECARAGRVQLQRAAPFDLQPGKHLCKDASRGPHLEMRVQLPSEADESWVQHSGLEGSCEDKVDDVEGQATRASLWI